MRRIGIYGGSFNPVHFGHVGLAKWVIENTDLDELWLMVSPNNPLKPANLLAPEGERLAAVRDFLRTREARLVGVRSVYRAEDVFLALCRPLVNVVRHRAGRGDRVNARNFRKRVGNIRGGVVAVHGF